MKVRPVVEQRRVCRRKEEEFCLDVVDREVRWRKWCREIQQDRIEEEVNQCGRKKG